MKFKNMRQHDKSQVNRIKLKNEILSLIEAGNESRANALKARYLKRYGKIESEDS